MNEIKKWKNFVYFYNIWYAKKMKKKFFFQIYKENKIISLKIAF